MFGPRARALYEPMRARLRNLMREAGLPFGDPERAFNTRLAQELGKWADGEGKPELHDALFRAFFVEGRDISDIDVLVNVAATVDLDEARARAVLESRERRDAVDADWKLARDLGITGVPTFVAEGRSIVGAQPYGLLERLVTVAGAARRSESGC